MTLIHYLPYTVQEVKHANTFTTTLIHYLPYTVQEVKHANTFTTNVVINFIGNITKSHINKFNSYLPLLS
jgi:hypothetical protein